MVDPNPGNNSATDSNTVIAPTAGSAKSVPTLGEWALMALSMALAGFAALRMRR
ncbi:IPTL-CTERM sorting domain-containing protein [Comamonas odontotermitis]|uniref:IPTL-CTERM sorting domain-containing protein n=1 Tax=Comamonas odontotermitis TaxID=379895 RepID=UPI001CC76678|nr:IPTL-CTERM sorting domain-containing protein [Comamonas odontotermitis]